MMMIDCPAMSRPDPSRSRLASGRIWSSASICPYESVFLVMVKPPGAAAEPLINSFSEGGRRRGASGLIQVMPIAK